MQLFGFGKKSETAPDQAGGKAAKSSVADIKHQLKSLLKLASRYESTIISLAVAILLAATALRMLHYMDPPVDDTQVQSIISKSKQVHIDPKIVQKLQQLQDSGTSTSSNVESGRTNPFNEGN
jgi:hypothetical protein